MANLKEWLLGAEDEFGKSIEAIVVGKHDNKGYREPAMADENIVLSRDAGLAKVDQEFDNGYGGADCFPLYAWTASRVFFVAEYDGATGLNWAPRNPMAITPEFSGNS